MNPIFLFMTIYIISLIYVRRAIKNFCLRHCLELTFTDVLITITPLMNTIIVIILFTESIEGKAFVKKFFGIKGD